MYRKYIKRPMDFILSLLAIIVLSPVFLVTALLVRIKLGSPVLFVQRRPGKDERIFDMYKFRTMTNERDEDGNLLPDEIRLTSFGKLLRRTSLDELPELLEYLQDKPRVKVQSIFSHLAASDDPQHDEFTRGQYEMYKKHSSMIDAVLDYKPIHHILNSAGIERFSEYQMDMARLGVGIYGISAVDQANVKPAASLTCKILQIKELTPEDGTVGYGRHGKLDTPKKIATLPLGYADGLNRHYSRGNAKFCVNGQLVPTIGNICMDMCMIDITGVDAKVGDKVTIFGENPTANDMARILDTIPYEIFTSVARRVKRVVYE